MQTFQRHLPLLQEPDLLGHWDFCYERSIGCVGILKDWLLHTLINTLNQGNHTFTWNDLQSHAPSLEQSMILFKEANAGEKQLDYHADASNLRISLGLEVNSNTASPNPETPVKKTRRSPVGQPKAQRRPVGGGYNAN